jgi:sulfur carrier protein
MNLTINGTAQTLPERTTLAELMLRENAASRGSAAAVDGVVVPRGSWEGFLLADGSSVEILTAVQGG